LAQQTKGIETRKDKGVLDEIPSAYKDLHAVMTYQSDLVEPVAHLQTVLCVKGGRGCASAAESSSLMLRELSACIATRSRSRRGLRSARDVAMIGPFGRPQQRSEERRVGRGRGW